MPARILIAYLLMLLMALGVFAALWHLTREPRAIARARRRRRRARRENWSPAPAEAGPNTIMVSLAELDDKAEGPPVS